MLSKKRSKIHTEFEINYPTENHIFNPTYRSITGSVKLSVIQDIKNIKCIDIGFRGNCFTEYNLITLAAGPVMLGGSGAAMRSKTLRDTKNIFEFEFPNAFPGLFEDVDPSSSTITLSRGQNFETPISFEFPVDLNLPSSCHNLGGKGENMGTVTIRYETYVSVHYISDFLNKDSYFEYIVPLDYQGGTMLGLDAENIADIDVFSDQAFLNCSSSNVFKNKMKVYLLDKSTGTLSENTIKSSHKRTRFIRQLWNNNYKESNICKVSKDIKLEICIQIPLLFNIVSSLSSIPVHLECPVPDISEFGVNGKTTKLGYFEVSDATLIIKNQISLSCQFRRYSCCTQNVIFSKSFRSGYENMPSFDINNFVYDFKLSAFVWDTTLGDLLGNDVPLIQQIAKPVMADVILGNIFSNSNCLEVKLVVSNGQIDGKQTQKFKFESPSCLTCRHPDFMATGIAPPIYTAVVSPEYHDREEPPPY